MKLTNPEIAVLRILAKDDFGIWTYAEITAETKLFHRAVVTAVRRLLRRGEVSLDAMFNEETGMLCGSGFQITGKGLGALKEFDRDDS